MEIIILSGVLTGGPAAPAGSWLAVASLNQLNWSVNKWNYGIEKNYSVYKLCDSENK